MFLFLIIVISFVYMYFHKHRFHIFETWLRNWLLSIEDIEYTRTIIRLHTHTHKHTHKEREEGRKEVFYLMTLNTFYLWLYCIRHMVKDHSNSKREKPTASTWTTLSN